MRHGRSIVADDVLARGSSLIAAALIRLTVSRGRRRIPLDERLRLRLHDAARPGRCRTTTPPIPACCGCSKAKRCGAQGRRAPNPAPIATATRRTSMKGVAARYPAFDAARGRRSISKQRINLCRTEQQQARRSRSKARTCWRLPPLSPISRAGCRSRHRRRARRSPFIDAGRDTYRAPAGPAQPVLRAMPRRQLGQEARRQRDPAGHPTGYPLYRLEWQSWARCSGGCATA